MGELPFEVFHFVCRSLIQLPRIIEYLRGLEKTYFLKSWVKYGK